MSTKDRVLELFAVIVIFALGFLLGRYVYKPRSKKDNWKKIGPGTWALEPPKDEFDNEVDDFKLEEGDFDDDDFDDEEDLGVEELFVDTPLSPWRDWALNDTQREFNSDQLEFEGMISTLDGDFSPEEFDNHCQFMLSSIRGALAGDLSNTRALKGALEKRINKISEQGGDWHRWQTILDSLCEEFNI